MSNLKEYQQAYRDLSGKASELVRQLSFAGIAFVWVLKKDGAGLDSVPSDLHLPALIFAIALLTDYLQYVAGALMWGVYSRFKERNGQVPSDTLIAPSYINLPQNVFYFSKQFFVMAAYFFICKYLLTSTKILT
ncbi:hypothetical protein [Xanthomonas oryzae]|uniref:hypothetical protein n=1 Tax=Xanthomonas oryzae TaxID=347 RepID=UPI000B2E4AE4|nr:hypothetical protein [Xanthomonas oryzae]WJS72050.1 hypothetical protein DXO50_015120 [Xanthomonas oryzae pv. oryzae]